MKIIAVDVETYYDNDYSLRRMTVPEYVMHPKFECIGWAVYEPEAGKRWYTAPEFSDYLRGNKEPLALVSHNALFDMGVLAWRFGYVPELMIDTLGMARAMLAADLKSLSLASVADRLGLGVKGDTVHKVVGMGVEAIRQAGIYAEYTEYAQNDAELAYRIFARLMQDGFPKEELLVMDTVIRCAVKPKFLLDRTVLAEHLHVVREGKKDLLDRCGLADRDALMSNDKFAEALRRLGVEPPTKTSLATGRTTYAFAKTDPDFVALDEHDNPDVQALVAARLGLKSTLEETRTERFIAIANLPWPSGAACMPIPLRYSGAHTHRLSGEWKINMQNLPRGGRLRKALVAPPGHRIVAADASQIEARMVAWFAGQDDLVELFAKGADVYSAFASKVFGYEVNKKDHVAERFVGKTAILGLGYGLGWQKFQTTVKLQSTAMAKDGVLPAPIEMDDAEAQRVVTTYRTSYARIRAIWERLNGLIPAMAQGESEHLLAPVIVQHQKIRLPSGLHLFYRRLRQEGGEWVFEFGGKPKRLYGGKLLENIIQSLARICVMDAAVRVRKRLALLGDELDLAMQVHDELVYVVPQDLAALVEATLLEEMGRRPVWAPTLPLAAEAHVAANYAECK